MVISVRVRLTIEEKAFKVWQYITNLLYKMNPYTLLNLMNLLSQRGTVFVKKPGSVLQIDVTLLQNRVGIIKVLQGL